MSKFSSEINHWGYLESKESYHNLLEQADIVVSTAVHEFQGLALLEGIAKGCMPIAPNRLAYPEYVPQHQLYESHNDILTEARFMADKIVETCQTPTNTHIEQYRASYVWPRYHSILGL